MKKQRGNNKRRANWFENQRRMNGVDFLANKTPVDLQKDANRVIKDMAYGNINQEDFKYFYDMRFLSTIKQSVNINWNFVYYTLVGMNNAFETNPQFKNGPMMEVHNIYANAANEYQLINNALLELEAAIADTSIVNKDNIFCDIFGRLSQASYKFRSGLNYQFLVIVDK